MRREMKLVLFLVLLPIIAFSQNGNLKGRISFNNEGLPSVNVQIENSSRGVISNREGEYEIENMLPGKYKIRFSLIGYRTEIIETEIKPNETKILNVVLEEQAFQIGEVRILGDRGQEQSDPRTSLISLNPREAKILPGAGEDVLRTLQALPGVLAPADFSSQLVVRGSGPDQNLIIIDDVEIFNPYRLYGAISMFNPDAVSEVNLITGGFPSRFGDRLSAVLEVTNREGTTDSYFDGRVNASIINANVIFEGKNPFGIKGSWLINSRRTYYDLIIEPFVKRAGLVDENVSFPSFYDVQSKFVFGPFDGHRFLFNAIYSEDGVYVVSGENRETPDSISVDNITKNNVFSAAWHYASENNFLNKLTASYYSNAGLTDFDSQVLDPSLNRDEFEGAISDTLKMYLLGIKFKSDFTFNKFSVDDRITYKWNKNIFEAGVGYDRLETIVDFRFELDPQLQAIISANPEMRAAISSIRDVKAYNRFRAFAQNTFAIGDRFFIQPGLRFDHYEILAKSYVAPRLSFSFAIDPLTTLRAVWGVYYQSPGYEKLVDQNVFFDLSKKFTEQLEAEQALHYVLGIERWISEEWKVKVEGYYKDFRDLIIQKRVPGSKYYTEPIPGRDRRLASSWTRPVSLYSDSLTQIPVNGSFGEAYGIEFLLEKRNITSDSKLNGWVSYSYAFANRYERGEIIPFRWDQRHTFNVVMNYRFNKTWDVGARWQYGSGFPHTTPVGIRPRIILQDQDGDGIVETPVIATRRTFANPITDEAILDIDNGREDRFNARKPAYHRLDIRVTAFVKLFNLDWSFYLDVINAYNHKNVIDYDYDINRNLEIERETDYMFPILPTIGFSVNF
ncbi:MAG: hypothetical protein C0425_04405 [Chlorobiaceae bacterium]|nr:hypothetical protein [Chlorobiaceae bacterium]MBA4309559.1 hypothetical protein [Chlorobiaceae bacterium]